VEKDQRDAQSEDELGADPTERILDEAERGWA